MLNQKLVFEELLKNKVSFFTGVPDSYLNGFCNYALDHFGEKNVIAANEGNAIAIAAGHYFASKEIPLVYFQNSGLGNAVNPLVSLVDENVYSVPMIILVGWRGQPGTDDWPQHKLQGELTTKLFDIMNIRYEILEDDIGDFSYKINKAAEYCRENRKPYGLISPKGIMDGDKTNDSTDDFEMTREEAIETIIDSFPEDTIYCATTGRATRELFYLRKKRGESGANDFLNVGSMGHASSVAFGIALQKPNRKVVVLDGDSAALMHMGSFTMVSKYKLPNLTHIVLNNGAHESVGGQESAGFKVDFNMIAKGSGYFTSNFPVKTRNDLIYALKTLSTKDKAGFINVYINKGLRQKLPSLVFSHRKAIDELIDSLNK